MEMSLLENVQYKFAFWVFSNFVLFSDSDQIKLIRGTSREEHKPITDHQRFNAALTGFEDVDIDTVRRWISIPILSTPPRREMMTSLSLLRQLLTFSNTSREIYDTDTFEFGICVIIRIYAITSL